MILNCEKSSYNPCRTIYALGVVSHNIPLRQMIKTFFERWYLLNRLFHYCRKRNIAWCLEEEFITYRLRGKNDKDENLRQIERNLIYKCTADKKGPGYICREKGNHTEEIYIQLTSLGEEVYSVSYLIFGHYYAKRFWSTLLLVLTTAYVTWRIERIIP